MTEVEKGRLGEEFVNNLAYKSFLRYWCYPGPKDELGDKKEIADLLVLFNNVCLIISVKYYDFKGDYGKYFRKTIEKASNQIYGAERKLFSSDREIFIKHPERSIEKFEKSKFDKKVRVIVNLGNSVHFYPSYSITKHKEHVHIFDNDAFEQIILELNTVSDFVEYLEKREVFLSNKDSLVMPGSETDFDNATGTEFINYVENNIFFERNFILVSGTEYDLLAMYLFNNRNFVVEDISWQENSNIFHIEGLWEDYLKDESVKMKKNEDRQSYFIDGLVQKDLLEINDITAISVAKELMALSRYERRLVAKAYLDFMNIYESKKGDFFIRRNLVIKKTLFVFILFNHGANEDALKFYFELAMKSFCVVNNYPTEKVVLIATSNHYNGFQFGYMEDIEKFTSDEEEFIYENIKRLNWYTKVVEKRLNEDEYPQPPSIEEQ